MPTIFIIIIVIITDLLPKALTTATSSVEFPRESSMPFAISSQQLMTTAVGLLAPENCAYTLMSPVLILTRLDGSHMSS